MIEVKAGDKGPYITPEMFFEGFCRAVDVVHQASQKSGVDGCLERLRLLLFSSPTTPTTTSRVTIVNPGHQCWACISPTFTVQLLYFVSLDHGVAPSGIAAAHTTANIPTGLSSPY
jgi:hypothetical protein